jgi:UPF0271 protein
VGEFDMVEKRIIDINSDIGEGFGNYSIGRDEEIIKFISSANVACGFHAGDPVLMRRSVHLAKMNNVAVGAHVGLPDLLGFGRREMDISEEECRDYVLYQIGALKAFVEANDMKLQHVSTHGGLFGLGNKREEIARAVVEAIQEIDGMLYFVSRPGLLQYEKAKEMGLRVKGYIGLDVEYHRDGTPIVGRHFAPVRSEIALKRAMMILNENRVAAVEGGYYEIEADTLVVHGSNPNVVENLRALREEIDKQGIQVAAFKSEQ